jgi:DNA-binding transcriptional regulator GbsR (MarR family)
MTSKNLYMDYLIQIKSAPVDTMLSHASAGCVELLGVIAAADFQGHPLTVSQVMAMIHLASPGTIHRRVESLRQKGLIDLIYKNGNRRTKYIVPTAAADAYFEKMGDVLMKTLSNVRKPHKAREASGELACAA